MTVGELREALASMPELSAVDIVAEGKEQQTGTPVFCRLHVDELARARAGTVVEIRSSGLFMFGTSEDE